MLIPFLHTSKDELGDEHPLIATPEQRNRNTNEGSEFLDDSLRMEDLIMPRTEESVAAGTPNILL
jgi:hypothetical protein